MRAQVLHAPAPAADRPLKLETVPDPVPGRGQVLVEVTACGVCRTDLHVIEGDLEVPAHPLVPGHEVVGKVAALGEGVRALKVGDRVGVAWVHRFCGQCDPCVEGRENLCLAPTFTGFHVNGGYAEQVLADAAYVYPLPDALGDDAKVAPLLCAGIIGYRALMRAGLVPGRRLALYGFGGSAHIALQVAVAFGCEVFVFSRGAESRARARALGAAWTGELDELAPRKVDHAVSFAPVGGFLPKAMRDLDRGGTLAIAGIYVDAIPKLDYDAELFQEKALVSVTANTRADGRTLLNLAARIGIETDVETYAFEDAGEALARLSAGTLGAQAAVLRLRD